MIFCSKIIMMILTRYVCKLNFSFKNGVHYTQLPKCVQALYSLPQMLLSTCKKKGPQNNFQTIGRACVISTDDFKALNAVIYLDPMTLSGKGLPGLHPWARPRRAAHQVAQQVQLGSACMCSYQPLRKYKTIINLISFYCLFYFHFYTANFDYVLLTANLSTGSVWQ